MTDSAERAHADSAPPVVVLIVNYRSVHALRACLASLREERVTRIVVLENGSAGDEWEALQELVAHEPRTVAYRSLENLGFGGGVNHLFNLVAPSADSLVWLLNPDTVVGPGSALALATRLQREDLGIIAPRILTGTEPPRPWFDYGRVNKRTGRTYETHRPEQLLDEGRIEQADYVSGAAMMISAQLFRDLGGFDARFFLYWEDVDLSLRARERGARIGVYGGAVVWHQEGGSSKPSVATRAVVYFHVSRNRILVCRRPRRSGIGLVLGVGAANFARLAAHAFFRGGPGRWRRLRAVVSGAVAALRMPSFVPAGTLEGPA